MCEYYGTRYKLYILAVLDSLVDQSFTYQYVFNIMSTNMALDVDSIIINCPRAYVSIFLQSNSSNTMYVRAGSRERDGLQSYHK